MQKFMRVDEIIAQRDIYLPLDELSIQCYMIKKTDIEDLRTETKCVKALVLQTVHDDLLRGLLQLYNDEKFCDFKIRTAVRTFNVHKIILCARSAVFTAMFNNDTIETREGVVKITDLDSDTVGLMLKFMYSNEFEVKNEDEATDLYIAADKYEIVPLKDRCCNWLKMSLNEENVCDTYLFADFHEDGNLKAAVQNYIFVRAHKILKSSYWNEFMKLYPRLASEITHKICLKYIDE
ncbi:hypothetical protein JTE90_026740 [Oedothorax gibbosus]|nr:hypothetical protein JTE90_026740 [Oedothorax gibbosus]